MEVTRYYYDGQTLDTTLLPGADGSHRDPAALLRAASQGQNVVLETDADEAPRRSFVHGSQYTCP